MSKNDRRRGRNGMNTFLTCQISDDLMSELNSFVQKLPAGFTRSQVVRGALRLGLDLLTADPARLVQGLTQ